MTRVVDMTKHEEEGRYLEVRVQCNQAALVMMLHHIKPSNSTQGTGSIVFDHVARRAFACTSLRTHPDVLKEVWKVFFFFSSTQSPGLW